MDVEDCKRGFTFRLIFGINEKEQVILGGKISKQDINTDNQDYQIYLEERRFLIQSKRESSNLFDKSILTLSAGAFGLSLTFYNQFVPRLNPGTESLLITAWISLGLSMIVTLISIFTSRFACLRGIDILEKEYLLSEQNEKETKKEKNYPALLTKTLNIFAITVFIVGIIFLAIFCIANLLNGGNYVW